MVEQRPDEGGAAVHGQAGAQRAERGDRLDQAALVGEALRLELLPGGVDRGIGAGSLDERAADRAQCAGPVGDGTAERNDQRALVVDGEGGAQLLADVTRMGRWSPECYRCEWDDAGTGGVPGARFRGSSRSGVFRWTRECVVTVAEPGVEFAFRTLRRSRYPDSTTWRFALTAVPGGTRLVQTMALSAGRGVLAFERVSGRDRGMPQAMAATLERIRADLSAHATAPSMAG
ncbi:SRPBCC family protein [Dactylosporangium sp. NBC_01737]|uniref:SRPBCC family protein n=1 Tax=Dactylosporangium sp. NBC_01737 TaxID=2975959 RepID=UPI002E138DE6|nr:SRPBCC family protein [Dactylosporangium sp. NBC_01737]